MAVDGLLNRYLLLALQHSHLYFDSLEKAKAVSALILLHLRPRVVPLLLSPSSVTLNKPRGKDVRAKSWGREACPQFFATPFFLAVFFRVSPDGLSERGATRSLIAVEPLAAIGHLPQADDTSRNLAVFPATYLLLSTFSPPI